MSGSSVKRLHLILVPALLLASAALAVSSLVGDSITFDETSHLASGASYLKYHDYRLSPDHPPLAKMWAAWPLFLTRPHWPPPTSPGWIEAGHYTWGEEFLFDGNDGQRLLILARCMMVMLLLVTCVGVYATARTLFGPSAGLLALALAAFSPTMLAHGRLVTTDLPVATAALYVLLSFALLMKRITWLRLLFAAAALGVLCLVKFTWPVVLIGPFVMVLLVVLRGRPPILALARGQREEHEASSVRRSRPRCCLTIGLLLVVFVLTTWAATWSAYGWQYPIFRDSKSAGAYDAYPTLRKEYAKTWDVVLGDTKQAGPLKRMRLELTAWLRDRRLLPEAYLYGLTCAFRTAEKRPSYLMGEYSDTGSLAYFPVAFAIKTPIPVLLLLAAGIVLLARRPGLRNREPILLAGVLAFAACYGLASIFSKLNIGHRHLLPLYPLVFILAGAVAEGWTSKLGRCLTAIALTWLVAANIRVYPHYLCYFNEFVGGPANGHKYLLDSNLDWGQDLIRLAAYQRQHSDRNMQLAYFGSVDPRRYGIQYAALPNPYDLGKPGPLMAGDYVVSVSQLLGVDDPGLRDAFWNDRQNVEMYRRLPERTQKPAGFELPSAAAERQGLRELYERSRRKRLINRLAHRPPDERVGYTFFVYHLSSDDISALTRP